MSDKQKAPVLLKKAREDHKMVLHMIAAGVGTDEQVGFWCQ